MRKVTKVIASLAALSMTVGMAGMTAGCGSSSADSSKGRVYFINSKSDRQAAFKEIADHFTKKTGIPVDISYMAFDKVTQTLKSELAKSKAPSIFEVDNNNFPLWTDYYTDMSNTKMYKNLQNRQRALKFDGNKIGAVPYVIERYGIVYNKALLQKYFDANWSTVKSIDKINNFKALKTVADEIQDHKADLGVKGAFAAPGFDPSSSLRYGDQLPHIPVYYEYRDQHTTTIPAKISGKYLPEFKNIFDLYLKDTTTPASQLSGITMDDANSEFALGNTVFIHDGTWSYTSLKGHKVPDKDMGLLPIYMGIPGEENAGLTESSMYLAINKNASKQDQEASRKFLDYFLTSNDARKIVSYKMEFETPFKSYLDNGFKTKNPLQRANDAYKKEGKYNTIIYPLPTSQWVQTLSDAMLQYAQGTGKWDAVKTAFVDEWASEYKTVHH